VSAVNVELGIRETRNGLSWWAVLARLAGWDRRSCIGLEMTVPVSEVRQGEMS
jgi:hypothetical protein